jgi:hypothetical protein
MCALSYYSTRWVYTTFTGTILAKEFREGKRNHCRYFKYKAIYCREISASKWRWRRMEVRGTCGIWVPVPKSRN